MQERYISSGSSRLHIAVWEPSGERKAIMQISHGMIEYIKRYSHFANYLNQAGILVIGNDHKGHGLTAEKDEDLGYFGEEKSAAVNSMERMCRIFCLGTAWDRLWRDAI